MGWIGSIAGSLLGGRLTGGIIGALAGAVLGDYLEKKIHEKLDSIPDPSDDYSSTASASADGTADPQREAIFLTALGAMLAKLSKADGHVDRTEIAAGERAFIRFGLSREKRNFCVAAFRRAKLDEHSIYEYADAFWSVTPSMDIRVVMYDILWDVACADGVVTSEEYAILQNIVSSLRIPMSVFRDQANRRLGGARFGSRAGGNGASGRASADRAQPADPYEILGCSPRASDAEVRKAYREKAKQFHPDLLRAQGVPEEMLAKANEQMARINAAWSEIKTARSL